MKTLFLLFSAILSLSCNRPSKQIASQTVDSSFIQKTNNTGLKDNFKTGEVIPSVDLIGDSSQKFALFLPKKYSESQKFPIVIFFDPHAEGTIPLNLYAKLAERFQFILMASNTSKNGLDIQQTNAISNNLIHEALSRFSVDKNNISLCGFSGGAKVALSCGAMNPDVNSVIYCGAAMQFNPSHKINLLGFAGKRDMNYMDLVSFEWSLEKAPFKHFLIEWNGKHEFPSADVFENAFAFLNTGEIENYPEKQVKITPQKVEEELGVKQKYINALQSNDVSWWKAEIKFLNTNKKNDLMYERLLGFISLACYSFSSKLLAQNDLANAEKILSIYKLADPTNKACEEFILELEKRKMNIKK